MSDQMREAFARWVHDAYGHLYDSHHLQNHPLGKLLLKATTENDSFQHSQALRRVLLDAIQSLRPQPKTPAQSPDWRLYSLLELRYIERLTPMEAMQQLSLSKSQFFRDQARALELLSKLLWERVQSSTDSAALAQQALRYRTDPVALKDSPLASNAQTAFVTPAWRLIHLGELLEDLLPIIHPLAERHQVAVETRSLFDLAPVRGDRVMVRQALLNVLTLAITSTTTQSVVICGETSQEQVSLRLTFGAEPSTGADDGEQGGRLALAQEIMDTLGGVLTEARSSAEQAIVLRWPSTHQKVLLMIDDNQGLVELFRRYLASEPWQILWAKNGSEARQTLEKSTPDAILLDIMMPDEDGWEVLLSLQEQLVDRQTPILICSVVYEPSLAESLGAAGYLPKPVSQDALLAVLGPLKQLR
jgi:CheY-like chemotaxis protein